MSIAAKDVVPFTRARATLSELADEVKQDSEKIITKNGESYVALIDADRLVPPPARDPSSSTNVRTVPDPRAWPSR